MNFDKAKDLIDQTDVTAINECDMYQICTRWENIMSKSL